MCLAKDLGDNIQPVESGGSFALACTFKQFSVRSVPGTSASGYASASLNKGKQLWKRQMEVKCRMANLH